MKTAMKHQHKCQMTIEGTEFPDGGGAIYFNCNKPARFKNPKPEMGVVYVCGIHARSLDKMFERTGQTIRCLPL